jgi:hypothetical protein
MSDDGPPPGPHRRLCTDVEPDLMLAMTDLAITRPIW